MFDSYQKSCHFHEDEYAEYEESMSFLGGARGRKNPLIEDFEVINRTIFELDLFDHLCGDIIVGVVQNKIRMHIETAMDNYQESFIKSFEHVSRFFNF